MKNTKILQYQEVLKIISTFFTYGATYWLFYYYLFCFANEILAWFKSVLQNKKLIEKDLSSLISYFQSS